MKRHILTNKPFSLQYNFKDYPYLHTHDYWEFTLITSGAYLHKINNDSFVVSKNTLLLLRPDDYHMLQDISKQASHINFEVSCEALKSQLDLFDPDAYGQLLEGQKISFLVSEQSGQGLLQKAIYSENDKGSPATYRYWMSQLFLSFIKELLYNCFMPDKSAVHSANLPDCVQATIELLNEEENFSLPLKEIIKKAAYSYVHIGRTFKQYLGTSLSDYFLAARMNYARILLERNYNILSVSEAIGYSNQSHFNLAFKKFYNITPSKYKKQWKEDYSQLEEPRLS